MHQHPSQALLDLRTILMRLGRGGLELGGASSHVSESRHGAPNFVAVHAKTLDGVTVVIAGDILHSRVARSNAILLPRLGAKVVLCGPEEFLPEDALGLDPGHGPKIEIERDFDRALGRADVVMMLRIQKERLATAGGGHGSSAALDLAEYIRRYQLTGERLAASAPRALVMHPGPMIRGLEIADEAADGPQSAIEEQVGHGLAVRRALLARALGVEA